jgi:hypothetical protein
MKKEAEIKLERKAFLSKKENISLFYDVASKALASGSYGELRVCAEKSTKEKRAVKIVPKHKITNVDSFLSEIEIMRMVVTIFE